MGYERQPLVQSVDLIAPKGYGLTKKDMNYIKIKLAKNQASISIDLEKPKTAKVLLKLAATCYLIIGIRSYCR